MYIRTRSYRRGQQALLASFLGGLLALGFAFSATAQGTFDGGKEIAAGGGYGGVEYAAAPYTIDYNGTTYYYGTGEDGKGGYATYDGSAWSDWYSYEDQPAEYGWQPAAVTYNDWQYVFYTGKDGKLYANGYDGAAWSGWQDQAGEYQFAAAPYADVYGEAVHLYGTDTTGGVYHKSYDGTAWSEWGPINEDYVAAKDYEPHAVSWGEYENVFWTGEDGKVYWNRYDGTAWTGAKALTGDGTYASAPYAIGYSGDDKIYAYAISADGAPYWNTFVEGEGWSDWQAYKSPVPTKVTYQPYAYEYDGVQYLYISGEDGYAYYTTYDGQYAEWTELGDNYAYEPQSFVYGDDYYLAYTGKDGKAYYQSYTLEADDGY